MTLYGAKKNILKEDAYRFENPEAGLKVYRYQFEEDGITDLECANKVDNLFNQIYFECEKNDCKIVVIDFESVQSVGKAFMRKFLLYIIETKFKIINVNMGVEVSNVWYDVCSTFFEEQDDEKED